MAPARAFLTGGRRAEVGLVAEPVVLEPGRTVRVELPGHRLEYRPVAGSDEVARHTVDDRGPDTPRCRHGAYFPPDHSFPDFEDGRSDAFFTEARQSYRRLRKKPDGRVWC